MSGADDQRGAETRAELAEYRAGVEQARWEIDRLRAELAETRQRADELSACASALYEEAIGLRAAGDALADAALDTRVPDRQEAHRLSKAVDAWRSVRGDAPTAPAADVRDPASETHRTSAAPAEHGDDPVERLTAALAHRERDLKAALTELHELKSAAPADDTAELDDTGPLTLDELIAAVDNALDCAAIDVQVWETDGVGGRTIESTNPLHRLTRCLRSYGLLDERRDTGDEHLAAGDELAASAGALISHTVATGTVPSRASGLWARLERAAKTWRSQR